MHYKEFRGILHYHFSTQFVYIECQSCDIFYEYATFFITTFFLILVQSTIASFTLNMHFIFKMHCFL